MLNFRNRDQLVPSVVTLLALLTLAGTLAYMLLVPAPSAAGIAKGRARSRRQLENEIDSAKTRTKEAKAKIGDRLWTGNADTIMAQVLGQLTARSNKYKLKMAAFRPQRPRSLGSLGELPCSVQVSGPYATVVAFLASLDTPDSRIALRSSQIASADGTTTTVTATLGLCVYYAETGENTADTKGGSRG